MSVVDWRSEQAYSNFDNAEAADIAWEWLRRESEYQSDYGVLASDELPRGAAATFRRQWGLTFRGRSAKGVRSTSGILGARSSANRAADPRSGRCCAFSIDRP